MEVVFVISREYAAGARASRRRRPPRRALPWLQKTSVAFEGSCRSEDASDYVGNPEYGVVRSAEPSTGAGRSSAQLWRYEKSGSRTPRIGNACSVAQ